MKKLLLTGLGIFLISANANAIDVGVSAKTGLNGIGLDFSVAISENVNARISYASIDIEGEEETVEVGDDGAEGDLDAELDFDYGSTALFIDWHVFGGGFRLTAGMFKNNGSADFSGVLQSAIQTDGENLDPSDIDGSIGGSVSLSDSFQPYIGVGWGRGAGGDGGLSLSFDFGVALLDTDVDFDANVSAGGVNALDQSELDSRLNTLESDAEADLEDLELWPVLAVGVNYAF